MTQRSEVSCCNLAMTMLSSARISSLTENSENARKCSAVYDHLRDDMLERHNWNFALGEVSLAQLTTTPTIEDWAYVYQLPTDCIRVIRQEGDYEFKVFGDKLYNNDSTSKIQYIKRIEDPTIFSSGFFKALASEIASTLAYGITQNAKLTENAFKLAEKHYKQATWADAQEGEGNKAIESSFITEREK